MFGMSSTEFWEEEPQLYWAYRFSYEKKLKFEQKKSSEEIKQSVWSQGKANEIATSVAISNAFSKKKTTFPTYEEYWASDDDNEIKKELAKRLEGVEDTEERGNIEFSYWARL